MSKLFLLFFILVQLIFATAQAQLEVPASWEHQVLHTEHFEVIHNTRQQSLAYYYAQKLEQAHKLLKPHFSVMPAKTIVIINDKTDQTNGYATRIPYPHMMIYPVLPGPHESLSDYGDWVLEFLIHEYTHILTFEPATGGAAYLRPIFGNVLAPNILLPQWWKEGLAVHMETKLSTGGRLRSQYQDSAVRGFIGSKTLQDFDLAEINEALPTWPKGMRPYLFGSLMWAGITHEHGDSSVDKLTLAHSARIPYFVEAPAKNILGVSYEQQYNKVLAWIESLGQRQLNSLQEQSVTSSQMNPWKNRFSSQPTIHPQGQYLAYIGVDYHDKRSLKIYQRQNGQNFFEARPLEEIQEEEKSIKSHRESEAPASGNIQQVRWFHHSPKLIYDKVDSLNRIERYSDLYTYDVNTKKTDRLSKGLRAREASPSPDDKNLIFILLQDGQTHLAEFDVATKKHRTLWSAPLGERISSPVYLNADEVLFALKRPHKQEVLIKFQISSSKQSELTLAGLTSHAPQIHGQNIYFLASENGIQNIYKSSLESNNTGADKYALTHSTTGFQSFTVDPITQDLYATEMTPTGPQIKLLFTKDLRTTTSAPLPKINSMLAEVYPEPPPPEIIENLEITERDYAATDYLWPQYWIPFLSTSSATGGLVFQATTSGFDPLKKHTYSATLNYDSLINKASFAGQYVNNITDTPIILSAVENNSYLGDYSNEIKDQNAQISALPDTWAILKESATQIGWSHNTRSFKNSQIKRSGPSLYTSWNNLSAGGDLISPVEGLSFYAGITRYIEQNDYVSHHQYIAGGSVYTDYLLPDRHALMWRLDALSIPEKNISAVYGAQSESYVLNSNSTEPQYLARAFNTGELFGRNLVTTNLEYRFPIKDIFRGSGTDPFYFRRAWGSLVIDGASLDGRAASLADGKYYAVSMSQQFWSYGAEIHLDTTLGYLFPVSFVYGYYYTPDALDGPRGSSRLSLQISGI